MYYKKANLPQIPNELLDDLDTIETFENTFPDKSFSHTYASYRAPKKLRQWTQSFFEYQVNTRYQVIKKKLPVHVDFVLTGVKYNYLISTGGTVKTRWWNSLDNPTEILFAIESQPLEWHCLNIEEPHDITDPTSPRISVVIENIRDTISH